MLIAIQVWGWNTPRGTRLHYLNMPIFQGHQQTLSIGSGHLMKLRGVLLTLGKFQWVSNSMDSGDGITHSLPFFTRAGCDRGECMKGNLGPQYQTRKVHLSWKNKDSPAVMHIRKLRNNLSTHSPTHLHTHHSIQISFHASNKYVLSTFVWSPRWALEVQSGHQNHSVLNSESSSPREGGCVVSSDWEPHL